MAETVEIGLNDIKSLHETRGWMMVTRGEPAALITIPSDLEEFEQIRLELIARCTAACSELNHGKTGDSLEVRRFSRGHGKTDGQRCCPDEQSSKRDHYAFALLLCVEFSCQQCRLCS